MQEKLTAINSLRVISAIFLSGVMTTNHTLCYCTCAFIK